MIDVSDIIDDPDFAVRLQVTRSSGGAFVRGGWQDSSATLYIAGNANTSTGDELKQLPEADRILGTLTFYSTAPLYQTRVNGSKAAISDVITYNGDKYRLAFVWDRRANGYYKAVGVRMAGA